MIFAAGNAVKNNVNKVEDWLPKSYVETSHLRWFRKHFVSDQVIVVSWDGCQLGSTSIDGANQDDPRIERLAQLLVPDDPSIRIAVELPRVDAQTTADASKYFKSVLTGRRLLDRMLAPPMSISPEEAAKRLRGIAIGEDGRQTCLIIALHDSVTREMKKVLGSRQDRALLPDVAPGLLHKLIEAAGIPNASVHLGGPPIDNVAIDEEGERTLVRLAGCSAILGLSMAWWSLRSVLLTGIVFATGVLSAATSLGIVWLTGQTMDAILMSMPSLVYVLAISGSVHLVNYYREAVLEGGLVGAAERAVAHAWKPALLCSTTTAIGLVSLYASELIPIQKFGIYSAIGVMSLLVILFFFLPAALHVTQIGRRWIPNSHLTDKQSDVSDSQKTIVLDSTAIRVNAAEGTHALTKMERVWTWLATGIVRYHGWVAAGCVLVIATVGYGLSRSTTSINLLELFDRQARILHDYRWLEKNLGMLVPLEVVVKFSPESRLDIGGLDAERRDDQFRLNFLERMETVAAVQETILQRFGAAGSNIVGSSLSALTFAPSLPAATGNTLNFMHRKALNMRLESCQGELEKSGFYKLDTADNCELWRISLRVAAFKGVDYGTLIGELNQMIEPVVVAHRQRVKVLRQLAQWDSTGNFAGARVLVWHGAEQTNGTTSISARTLGTGRTEISAVSALLSRARCKVFNSEAPVSQTPLVQLERLDSLDAVVLAGDFSDTDLRTLQGIVPRVIDARSVKIPEDSTSQGAGWVSVIQTGVIPIVYKAQRSLLNSLIQSTIWSFLTITPLMMLVSRSAAAGMVAMIPNVLPVLLIFGGMGWMGIAIDIGSMMSASIALGVAVDDTIHFLAWYREELNRLLNRRIAIVVAYRRCATPTLQAALISGLGLSVFALSTFTPTQRFGWLMLTILLAGVVAELIMLPAILAGPLGRFFRPESVSSSGTSTRLATRARATISRLWTDEPPESAASERKAA